MKAFLASIVAMVIIAVGAMMILDRLHMSSRDVYQSSHGTTRVD